MRLHHSGRRQLAGTFTSLSAIKKSLLPRTQHLATLLLCSSGLLLPAAVKAAERGGDYAVGNPETAGTGAAGVLDMSDAASTSVPVTYGAVSYEAGTASKGYQKTDAGTTTITDTQSYTGFAGSNFPTNPKDQVPNGDISIENGKLNVAAGGNVSNDGYVIVGRDATPAGLDITNGGQLNTTANANIGQAANSTGEMTVDGHGSVAKVDGLLSVANGDPSYGTGDGGSGSLNITNGGAVDAGDLDIANYADSKGTINVAGTDSTLTVQRALAVNGDGTGTLNIEDGGTARANGQVMFGDGTGLGNGTLNLNAGGRLIAGDIPVDNGAILQGEEGIIANDPKEYAFNLNGGELQLRNGSNLHTAVNMNLTDGANGPSTIDTNGGVAALSGVLSGTGALNKDGLGNLTLTGENTYTGDTTVKNGVLQLGDGGSTGAIASKNITLASDSANLTLDHSNDLTLASNVDGQGSLTKLGAGTATVTGNVELEGTDVGSTLFPTNPNDAVPGGSISVQDGKLDVSGGHVTNNGYVIVGRDANAAGMDMTNGGTLDAKGNVNIGLAANSTGEMTVDGQGSVANVVGQLAVGNGDSNYGTGSGGTGTLNVINGGQVSANQVILANYDNSTGTVNVSGNGSELTAGQMLAVNGSGNGTLNVGDGGTVRSNGQMVFGDGSGHGSGTANINAGGLLVAGDINGYNGIVATGSDYAFNMNGGTLQVRDGSNLTTAVNMTLTDGANGASTIDTNGGNADLSGVLSGSGALNKDGLGNLTLTGDNTYTGDTTVKNGVLQLGDGGTTGSVASKNITLVSDSSNLTLNHSNDIALAQTITGAGSLTQLGTGTATLTGNVDLEGTDVGSALFPTNPNDAVPGGSISVQGGKLDIAGGHVANNGYVIVGRDANAAGMDITNAGTLDTKGNVNIGLAANSTGEMTVDGQGARANIAGSLTVGNGDSSYGTGTGGTGTLNVINGGQVSANQVILANYDNSTGTVNVSGNGSELTAGQMLAVNGSGNGTLNVGDGGTVRSNGQMVFGDGSGHGSGTANINAGGLLVAGDINGYNGIVATGSDYAFNMNGGTLQVRDGSNLTTAVNMTLIDGANGASNFVTTAPTGANGQPDDTQGNMALSGVLSGTGALNKAGLGTLTLTGDNTYTGDTTVQDGVLQLGDGGTTGSVASKNIALVSDGSNLTLNHSNDIALDQTISGAGSLTKLGTDTAALTGDNTYTGDTTVQDGVLQLGDGGTTGSVASKNINLVSDGSNLTLNRSNDMLLSSEVNGAGSLTKLGAGTATLTGDNTYTGDTTVSEGTLNVLGSTASSANTTVAQAGTLTGTGTIGNTNVFGTFAPGLGTSNPYGKMQVNGSVNMASGSTYVANVGGDLASSYTNVSGSFNIASGSTLHVNAAADANLNIGEHYTLVNTGQGVTGTFSNYDQSGLIATHSLLEVAAPVYTADQVQIGLMRNRDKSFCTGAGTRNECAAGHGLDGVVNTTGDNAMTNIVAGLSNNQRYRALDALSGEIHASARTAMINDSYYIRNTVIDRLDCVDDELRRRSMGRNQTGYCNEGRKLGKFRLWGTVYGDEGHNGGSHPGATNALGLSTSNFGWLMGADTRVDQWRVGGMLAYGRSWFSNAGARDSSSSSNNVTLGAYAGTAWKVGGLTPEAQVTLKLGADYTWNVLHSNRTIRFPGYYGHTTGNNLGGTAQVFGESGYKFIVMPTRKNPVELEPFARMTWVNYNSSRMHENGDAYAALRVKGQDSSMGYATFGLKAATRFQVGKGWISPHVMAAYRYAYGITRGTVRERFASAGSSAGYDMDVIGTPLSTNTALLEAGVNGNVTERVELGLDFIGQYGNRITSSGGMGHVTYRW